jgi:dihydrofolate synthase/folylpolyglutamate synthase
MKDDKHYLEIEGARLGPFSPPPPAALQQWNTACALAAVKKFAERRKISWDEKAALASLKDVKLPGRFEVCSEQPKVIIDGAHTRFSIEQTLLEASSLSPGGVVVVFGIAQDKSAREILDMVVSMSKEIIFTTYPGGRAQPPEHLRTLAGGRGKTAYSPEEALSLAQRISNPQGAVLVIGSFYLAGEVRQILNR